MADKKKTLMILSPGFAKNEEDTTCLPGQQVFVKSLNRRYPSLHIIILAFQYPFSREKYKWFGNDVISFSGIDKRGIRRFLVWLRVYNTLKKLNRQYKIIGLLSFWCTECALTGKYFSKNHHIKFIVWLLGQDAKKNNKFVKWIKPVSAELVALSDFLAETFYKNHGVKPHRVIPNGVDTAMFFKDAFDRRIHLLGVGSLIQLKQYDIFIEVAATIYKSIPSVKVVLCGKGVEEEKLREMLRQYKLEDNFHLTGEKQHREVLHLMQQSKIFLHTSSYEGFSGVCLEALYAGAHVISFTQPMNHSIQNWHVVKSKEQMVEKALYLLNDSSTQYIPVLPYAIDDNAIAMMNLFGYHE